MFDNIIEFGAFAFNKSHAVAYGHLAYWAMWMKAHYPKEFLKVALSSTSDDDKIKKYIKEARRLGIDILPPSVSLSGEKYKLEEVGIRVGLIDIKNVGQKAIQEITGNQPYKDFYDFESKVDRRRVHKGVFRSLALAGALGEFCSNHRFIVDNFEDALKAKSKKAQKEWLEKLNNAEELEDYTEEEEMEIKAGVLAIPPEKHPMEFYRDVLENIDDDYNYKKVKNWQKGEDNVFVSAGIISNVSFTGGSGQVKRVYIYLEDEDTYEVLMFNEKVRNKWGDRIEDAEYEPLIVEAVRNEKGLCVAINIAWIKDFREHIEQEKGFTEFEKSLLKKPDSEYEGIYNRFGLRTIKQLKEISQEKLAAYKMVGKPIKIGGTISKCFEYEAKNGLMAFIGIKSGGHNVEITVFAGAYKKFKDAIKIGKPVAAKILPSDNPGEFIIGTRYTKGCKVVLMEELIN
jgi:DNA polymerase III alpha subunit